MGMVGGVGCTCSLSHRSAREGQAPPLLTWPRYHLFPIVTDGESLTAERGHESFAGDKTEANSASVLD